MNHKGSSRVETETIQAPQDQRKTVVGLFSVGLVIDYTYLGKASCM